MTVEDRLRQAMGAETEAVDRGIPRAWSKIQSRVRRRRLVRATSASVLGAAALFAVVVGAGSLVRDDGSQRVDVVPATEGGSTSTSPPTSTSTVAPTTVTSAVPPVGEETGEIFAGIWPFATQEAVDDYVAEPGVGMFFDAEATALEFSREYLGFPDPVVIGDPVVYDRTGSEIEVAARPDRPMTTSVVVRRFGGTGGPYSVTEAFTQNIEVYSPAHRSEVATDIVLSGISTAFEAHVTVEVHEDGQAFGQHLFRSFVMGGANGEMGPFESAFTIEPPTAAAGAIVLTTESAEDGAVQEATVVRVAFDQP